MSVKSKKGRTPAQNAPELPKNKWHVALAILLLVLFCVPIFLVIWGINIYRRTIIEPASLFIIVSLAAISAAFVLFFWLNRHFNVIMILFMAAMGGGGTAYFLTLYLNRAFAAETITSKVFKIRETGNMASGRRSNCGQPYILINFYGREKQLVFSCEDEETIHQYQKVKLDYSKGLWGFPVVHNQVLLKE